MNVVQRVRVAFRGPKRGPISLTFEAAGKAKVAGGSPKLTCLSELSDQFVPFLAGIYGPLERVERDSDVRVEYESNASREAEDYAGTAVLNFFNAKKTKGS